MWIWLERRATDHTLEQLPLFTQDTDGVPSKERVIMGRRNWCSVRWEKNTKELSFDTQVERQKGVGETAGYAQFFSRLSGLHLVISSTETLCLQLSRQGASTPLERLKSSVEHQSPHLGSSPLVSYPRSRCPPPPTFWFVQIGLCSC